MNLKPQIVKIVEPVLEEKAPPTEEEYEFVETYKPEESKNQKE